MNFPSGRDRRCCLTASAKLEIILAKIHVRVFVQKFLAEESLSKFKYSIDFVGIIDTYRTMNWRKTPTYFYWEEKYRQNRLCFIQAS